MALGSKVTVKKVVGRPPYNWRANFIEEGKRRQKYFKTKAEAEEWADDRRGESLEHGTVSVLTGKERSVVVDTRERLEELGWDLRTALEFANRAKAEISAFDVSPDAALDFVVDYYRRSQKSISVDELVEEIITAKKNAGRSKRHEKDLRSKLDRFKKSFPDRAVATLESGEIEDWLHELNLSPGSVNSYRRILVLAFNYALKRRYCTENPVLGIDQVSETESEPETLTIAQIDKLLTNADELILPAIAIAAFAGLRSSEIEGTADHPGLKWSDIDFEEGIILVRADVAKGRRKRHVEISDNLRAWLKLFAKLHGKVWPANGRKLHEACRRRSGFGTPGTETDGEKKKGFTLQPWPRNALRHSYASYYLAAGGKRDQLVLAMGHKDDGDTLYNHYRGIVKPKAAKAYWGVMPEAETEQKIIPISA